MTPLEEGFMLLCSRLGDPERPVLTGPQLRNLTNRVRQAPKQTDSRILNEQDLQALGYGPEQAQRILMLLDQQKQARRYAVAGKLAGCVPLTLASAAYPRVLKNRLGADSPGVLWAKGDLSLLERPAIAVVGSREPEAAAREFAAEAGAAIARQGYVLVSGNARGVDSIAQNACLSAGGSVISVVADQMQDKLPYYRVLYLCEDSFNLPFSAQRALSRNRVIHCLGQKTLVAQCGAGRGGTWDGSVRNLKKGWSPLFCLNDESQGAKELEYLGAQLIGPDSLQNLEALQLSQQSFL